MRPLFYLVLFLVLCNSCKDKEEDPGPQYQGCLLKEEVYTKGAQTTGTKYEYNNAGKVTKTVEFYRGNVDVPGAITSYSYGQSGRFVEVYTSDPENKIFSRHTRVYDTRGNIIEWVFYEPDNKTIQRREITEYDENNREVKRTILGKGGEVQMNYTVSYTPQGNIETEIIEQTNGLNSTTNYVYIYDPNGRKLEQRVIIEGRTVRHFTYRYDSTGNLLERKFYDETGSLSSVTEYTYTDREKISKSFNGNGELTVTTTIEYNGQGQEVSNMEVHKDGKSHGRTSLYDAQGNLISQQLYDNGKMFAVKNCSYECR
jgi:antitoxin component YwqK of YwqJK toxin-antitoxin module